MKFLITNLQQIQKNSKNNKGSSLIELSIVLIILGLLVAGVSGGASLIKAAKQRKIINKFKGFETAYYAYYTQHSKVPGALSTDSSITGSSCSNGYKVFTDLKNAELIDDEYKTHSASGDICIEYIIANDLPYKDENGQKSRWTIMNTKTGLWSPDKDKIKNAVFLVGSHSNDWSHKMLNSTGIHDDMSSIDKKIDDGNSDSGRFIFWGPDANSVGMAYYFLDI